MTPSLPRISLWIHGGPSSIEAVRARGLTQNYPPHLLQFLWRDPSKLSSIRSWWKQTTAWNPNLLYVINTAFPGALLAPAFSLARKIPYCLDTGDAVFEMARTSGVGAGWKLPLLAASERLAHHLSARLIVRGSLHQQLLQKSLGSRVHLLRDGFAPQSWIDPNAVRALQCRLNLNGKFVVGLLGSLVWSPRLKICYGWDLIHALAKIPNPNVVGVIIGDGDGLPRLQSLARQLGVDSRVHFLGRIPYAEVPTHLQLFDVALSTQTNNLPGRVRTTGKLPEYMAAARFILASRVGEAQLVLPELMTLEYHGAVDPSYPEKIAERVQLLVRQPELLSLRHTLPAQAEKVFSYDRLSTQWMQIVAEAADSSSIAPA